MNKDYIVNHLKYMVKQSEKDIEEYKDIPSMQKWAQGVKDGLELSIQFIEETADNK